MEPPYKVKVCDDVVYQSDKHCNSPMFLYFSMLPVPSTKGFAASLFSKTASLALPNK